MLEAKPNAQAPAQTVRNETDEGNRLTPALEIGKAFSGWSDNSGIPTEIEGILKLTSSSEFNRKLGRIACEEILRRRLPLQRSLCCDKQ